MASILSNYHHRQPTTYNNKQKNDIESHELNRDLIINHSDLNLNNEQLTGKQNWKQIISSYLTNLRPIVQFAHGHVIITEDHTGKNVVLTGEDDGGKGKGKGKGGGGGGGGGKGKGKGGGNERLVVAGGKTNLVMENAGQREGDVVIDGGNIVIPSREGHIVMTGGPGGHSENHQHRGPSPMTLFQYWWPYYYMG